MAHKTTADHIHRLITDHMDDITTFAGGAGTSLFAWVYTHPEVVVGKLLATLVLGFVGGVGGLSAKYLCNQFFKKPNRKNPRS